MQDIYKTKRAVWLEGMQFQLFTLREIKRVAVLFGIVLLTVIINQL